MRTTLDIDDDLLEAAKQLARRERSSAGEVISRLVRQSLTGFPAASAGAGGSERVVSVAGFQPFPARGGVVTDDLIDAIRDAEGI